MEEITIFYDDTKKSCRDFAKFFEKYDNVVCKKASEYVGEPIILNTSQKIGLIFESENGKVPYCMSHIIWKSVASKKRTHMILVTGGKREFRAVKRAKTEMEQRGYRVANVYTRYLLEKDSSNIASWVYWIMDDLTLGQENILHKEKYTNLTKKAIRKHLREEMKQYRKYEKQKGKKKRSHRATKI